MLTTAGATWRTTGAKDSWICCCEPGTVWSARAIDAPQDKQPESNKSRDKARRNIADTISILISSGRCRDFTREWQRSAKIAKGQPEGCPFNFGSSPRNQGPERS